MNNNSWAVVKRLSSAILLLLFLFCLFAPIFQGSMQYRSVSDLPSQRFITINSNVDVLVANGQLYLPFAYRTKAILLTVGIWPVVWDIDKLKKLRGKHPELENKWPNPSKVNAGISWINEATK